jgi:hypothetical protein
MLLFTEAHLASTGRKALTHPPHLEVVTPTAAEWEREEKRQQNGRHIAWPLYPDQRSSCFGDRDQFIQREEKQ